MFSAKRTNGLRRSFDVCFVEQEDATYVKKPKREYKKRKHKQQNHVTTSTAQPSVSTLPQYTQSDILPPEGYTSDDDGVSPVCIHLLMIGLMEINLFFLQNFNYCLNRNYPASTRHRPNVGPPSMTLAQHWVDVSCLLGTCPPLYLASHSASLFVLIPC